MSKVYFVKGFGILIIPTIKWLTSWIRVDDMNELGKAAVNLQLIIILYILLSIPAILLLGLGILTLIATAILEFVMPVVNAVHANYGEAPRYFGTIPFIS
ncbi:MAG: DUF4870 domain-containing protein [Eudoraea sp.]|nr:DUF4870 domain-containing protein [Eudoraea sp.]